MARSRHFDTTWRGLEAGEEVWLGGVAAGFGTAGGADEGGCGGELLDGVLGGLLALLCEEEGLLDCRAEGLGGFVVFFTVD